MRVTAAVDAIVHDIRHGVRVLSRRKGWTAVALITLGLGIGAATAVFSVVDSLILDQLSYPDADRVVLVWSTRTSGSSTFRTWPELQAVDAWRASSRSVEAFGRYMSRQTTFASPAEPDVPIDLNVAAVDTGFLRLAGARTVIGRTFDRRDGLPGGERVAMLSEATWRGRFAASPAIVGQHIRLDDTTYTIVGVVSDRLRLPVISQTETQVWLPLAGEDPSSGAPTLARLAPRVSLAAAQRDLDAIRAREPFASAASPARTTLERPRDSLGSTKAAIYLVAAAAALLLIVTMANIAHLVLAQGAAREHEMAIRRALGAGRRRIIQQVLIESALLAAPGGMLGIGLGFAGLRTLVALRPTTLQSLDRATIDGRVLLAALALTVLTAIGCGLLAGTRAVRRPVSRRGRRGYDRYILLMTETSLAALLLTGAMVVVRSVINLERIDPGFEPAHLYVVDPHLSSAQYPTAESRRAVVDQLAARARSTSGVSAVALASGVPPIRSVVGLPLEVQTKSGPRADHGSIFMPTLRVDGDFFSTLRIPFVQGRTFARGADARHEVVIDETLARRLWPSESAIGHQFRFVLGPGAPPDQWSTVVGVTHDIMSRTLTSMSSDAGLIYYPIAAGGVLVIRASDPAPLLPALRAAARQIDPSLTRLSMTSVADGVSSTIAFPRFMMTLLTMFAAVTLVLSAVGLYGVVAHRVAVRTREIGVRIALGATTRHIASSVAGESLAVSAMGLAVGLTGAVWGVQLVRAALFEVTRADLSSYLLTAAVVTGASLIACIVPLRRAVAIDPATAMRTD